MYIKKIVEVSIASKIQFILSFLSVGILLMVGVIFIRIVVENYQTKLFESYHFKTKNIASSIQKYISGKNYNQERLDETIIQEAKQNGVDIHVFNNSGELLYSSIPEVFDKKILFPFINITPNNQLSIRKEKECNLEYFSTLHRIESENNNILGYFQIPFFSHRNEVYNEVLGVLQNVVVVFVLILFLFLFLGYKIADTILYPLRLLSQRMKNFNAENEQKIIWDGQSSDEIDNLVHSYNTMIDELKKSRNELSKHEREIAWREMAKQVAHEVKNPLTPIKLHMQLLQNSLNKSDDELKKLIKKATDSTIDQVEVLKNIADSFSNFAALPAYSFKECNINEILEKAILLHSSNVKIILHKMNIPLCVYVDSNELGRVFSNLIINAIQAKSAHREMVIDIRIKADNSFVIVSVSDNGIGIENSIKEKVFVPNFSTKYSGSGIGLALAKKSIEEMKGVIWFDSEVDKGTTFYVRLPINE